MKRVKLIGGICVVSILIASLCAVPVFADKPQPEAGPQSEAGPLPPSIMPVIILQGSDYEMGYQYGQQAGQYIEIAKDRQWALRLAKMSYEDVIYELKGYQYYIKILPEVIEEMKGMADGATDAGYEVSYADVLLINCQWTGFPVEAPTYPPVPPDEELPPTECSNFAAWGSATTDGSLICGSSYDTNTTWHLALVAFPDNGNSYISVVRAGELSDFPSINSKGVFLGLMGGFAPRDVDWNYGIPWTCHFPHLLQNADSAAEALDMLFEWQLAISENYLIADVNGNAFVAEVSAAFKAFREPGQYTTGEEEYGEGETDFIYATNNPFTDDGGEAYLGVDFIPHAGWYRSLPSSSIDRNKELWTMFTRYLGEVDLDFAKMMWRFPGEILPEDYGPESPDWGKHVRKICNLDNEKVVISMPDDGDNGVMYICTGPAGRVNYPLSRGGHYYQIEGTHSFFQLALAADPASVVNTAKRTARRNYIAAAYQKLMWLNYGDSGFEGLNALFTRANAEYHEGNNWADKAVLAEGDEALLYYARAATAYTRSQAYAKQLYNALVPPADDPTDLGLQPYKETAWLGQ